MPGDSWFRLGFAFTRIYPNVDWGRFGAGSTKNFSIPPVVVGFPRRPEAATPARGGHASFGPPMTTRSHAVGGPGNGSGWKQSSPLDQLRCRGSPGRHRRPESAFPRNTTRRNSYGCLAKSDLPRIQKLTRHTDFVAPGARDRLLLMAPGRIAMDDGCRATESWEKDS